MLSFIACALSNPIFAQEPPVTQSIHTNAAAQVGNIRPAFTNLAGKVIYKQPQTMTDTHVRLGNRNIPLAVFPEHEQRRIRLILGRCRLPVELEKQRDFYSNALERLAVLEQAELISQDKAEARRQKILAAWHKALTADTTLLPGERAFWSHPQKQPAQPAKEDK